MSKKDLTEEDIKLRYITLPSTMRGGRTKGQGTELK